MPEIANAEEIIAVPIIDSREEAAPEPEERIEIEPDIGFETLDFSDFDQEPLGWSLSLNNDIDNEDAFSVSFVRIPKYQGQTIAKGMPIEIPAGSFGTIKMLVREIDYNLTPDRSSTTILLGTRKIELNSVKPGGLTIENEKPSIVDVIKLLEKELMPNGFDDIYIDEIPFPAKKFVISGNQNVLAYLKAIFKNDTTKMYRFWVDAFNVFHVHKRDGIESTPIDLDFNEIKGRLTDLTARVFYRNKDKDVGSAPNYNDPKAEAATELKLVANLKDDSVEGIGYRSVKNRSKRTGASGDVQQEADAVKKTKIDSNSVSLTMLGIYWYHAHSKARLSNFELSDLNADNYVLTQVNISQRSLDSPPETTLMLESPLEYIGELTALPEDEDSERKKTRKLIAPIDEQGNVGEIKTEMR